MDIAILLSDVFTLLSTDFTFLFNGVTFSLSIMDMFIVLIVLSIVVWFINNLLR